MFQNTQKGTLVLARRRPGDGKCAAHGGFDSGSGTFGVHAEWQRKNSKGDFESRAPNKTPSALTGVWREVERLSSDDEGIGVSGRVSTLRDISKQEGQPPETFTGIWAETRCRWETHVALAANM